MEEQKTYLKRMAENLEQLDAKIAELKTGAEKATAEAKADLKRRLEDLRSTLDVAQQRLQGIQGRRRRRMGSSQRPGRKSLG